MALACIAASVVPPVEIGMLLLGRAAIDLDVLAVRLILPTTVETILVAGPGMTVVVVRVVDAIRRAAARARDEGRRRESKEEDSTMSHVHGFGQLYER